MTRGTGITTKQMEGLPIGGLFIWCNDKLDYPKRLQAKINRPDIMVVGPNWVIDTKFRSREFPAVEVDHAYRSHQIPSDKFMEVFTRIRIKT